MKLRRWRRRQRPQRLGRVLTYLMMLAQAVAHGAPGLWLPLWGRPALRPAVVVRRPCRSAAGAMAGARRARRHPGHAHRGAPTVLGPSRSSATSGDSGRAGGGVSWPRPLAMPATPPGPRQGLPDLGRLVKERQNTRSPPPPPRRRPTAQVDVPLRGEPVPGRRALAGAAGCRLH
jgi:hypothetical protein